MLITFTAMNSYVHCVGSKKNKLKKTTTKLKQILNNQQQNLLE